MLDDVPLTRLRPLPRPAALPPDWLPPEAPLAMPVQVIERPRRRAWLRRLLRAAG